MQQEKTRTAITITSTTPDVWVVATLAQYFLRYVLLTPEDALWWVGLTAPWAKRPPQQQSVEHPSVVAAGARATRAAGIFYSPQTALRDGWTGPLGERGAAANIHLKILVVAAGARSTRAAGSSGSVVELFRGSVALNAHCFSSGGAGAGVIPERGPKGPLTDTPHCATRCSVFLVGMSFIFRLAIRHPTRRSPWPDSGVSLSIELFL